MKTFKEWYNENKELSRITCAEAINYMHLEKLYRDMALKDMKLRPDDAVNFVKLAYGIVEKNMRPVDRDAFVKLFDALESTDATAKNSEVKKKCNS